MCEADQETIRCLEDELSAQERRYSYRMEEKSREISNLEYDMDRMKDDFERRIRDLEDKLSDCDYKIRCLESDLDRARLSRNYY